MCIFCFGIVKIFGNKIFFSWYFIVENVKEVFVNNREMWLVVGIIIFVYIWWFVKNGRLWVLNLVLKNIFFDKGDWNLWLIKGWSLVVDIVWELLFFI